MTVQTGLRGAIYSACHATQDIGNLLPSQFLLHNGGFELRDYGAEDSSFRVHFSSACRTSKFEVGKGIDA